MAKKRPNGTGSVLKLNVRGKDGELTESRFYYIMYSLNGKQKREATGTEDYETAKNLLATRIGEHALGMKPTADVKTFTYEEMAKRYEDQKREDGASFHQKLDGTEYLPGKPNLDEFFAGKRVLEITSDTVRAYKAHRTKAGVQGPTIRRELTTLRAMFNLARKEGKLRLADVPYFPMPADSKPRKGFVDPEVFAQLLDKLPANLRPIVLFIYCTGMRSGAAKQITWEMLDEKCTELNIPGDIMKNDEPLTLPLVGEDLGKLAAMLKKQFRKPGPMFDATNLRKEWATACHELGLGVQDKWRYHGLRLHDFRRSAVRNLKRAGVMETVAMKISGHKTRSIFDRYNITDTRDVQDALVKVGAYSKRQRKGARVAAMPKPAKGGAR